MAEQTQNQAILDYLEKGNKITPLEALMKFNCFRLSARIFNLKAQGHKIITHNKTVDGKSFAEYRLQTEQSHD